ncbi:hypothetical protein LS72_003435 [Helicobacter apodemus]|uniref:Uncharacterized protein n=1 Tax=Helicobacter apodemus TaxID=135569 RepID=A0A099UH00_9HELI|nr:hypothetical protein [Helicobacter apodemus]AWI33479.1 hypothetical protein CDV25_00945 [Helicobacter apodemus]MDE6959142.1 hypothetical protein [Helicobacter apodemus]TLE16324.1 hypothetical protein LS72_003435 [Helicobacter apodemus]
MCVLCGELITNIHWSEGVSSDEKEVVVGDKQRDRMRQRLQKVQVVNKVLSFYGLQLKEWNASKFVLSDKKGNTKIINHLGELWERADSLTSKDIDVLDTKLLGFLQEHYG